MLFVTNKYGAKPTRGLSWKARSTLRVSTPTRARHGSAARCVRVTRPAGEPRRRAQNEKHSRFLNSKAAEKNRDLWANLGKPAQVLRRLSVDRAIPNRRHSSPRHHTMLRNAVSAYGARVTLGAAAVAVAVPTVTTCAKDDKKSTNSVTSNFDPEALERGAKALREINNSTHAKRVG